MGIALVNGLAFIEPLIVLIRNADRTDLGAVTTSCAFVKIHISRLLTDSGREITRLPVQV